VSRDPLAAHLRNDHYGSFWLTDAIRPSPSVRRQIVPTEGYRVETYKDPRNNLRVPVLAAAVSREKLFDVFLDLMTPLGEVVDVVLETSHDSVGVGVGHGEAATHRDLFREQIDLAVLKSVLCDFEELLLHDGCTGLAVLSCGEPIELQFDEHKLLIVYAHDLEPFQHILGEAGVARDDDMKLITEGEHLHSTDVPHREAFDQLCLRLGVGETAERVNW
jgi:hypothetical protein